MSRSVVEGELTIHTAAERRASLLEMIHPEGSLDLDLSGVTELDTAGLQVLLFVRREVAQLGGRLTVSAISRAVAESLAIVRLGADDLACAPGATGSTTAAPSPSVDRPDLEKAHR